MGASLRDSDGPLQCFNAAQHWQLGWFSTSRYEFETGEQSILIIPSQDDIASRKQFYAIKFGDYYVEWNRAKGYKKGTRALQNKLTIIKSEKGSRPQTWVSSALDASLIGTTLNFDLVEFELCDVKIDDPASFDYAYVVIREMSADKSCKTDEGCCGRCVNNQCITVSPMILPGIDEASDGSYQPSIYPSLSPSSMPSSKSKGPSMIPSTMPSLVHSQEPSQLYSEMPSISPTTAPSAQLTDNSEAPSDSPSSSLSFPQSEAPSAELSLSPTTEESTIPSLSPSNFRSNIPSLSASDASSDVPTLSPSLFSSVGSEAPTVITSGEPSTRRISPLTSQPSTILSITPSTQPTEQEAPSGSPNTIPSIPPSLPATIGIVNGEPTLSPSGPPSSIPSTSPSTGPTGSTGQPTNVPSSGPSITTMSSSPSMSPSIVPSAFRSGTDSLLSLNDGLDIPKPGKFDGSPQDPFLHLLNKLEKTSAIAHDECSSILQFLDDKYGLYVSGSISTSEFLASLEVSANIDHNCFEMIDLLTNRFQYFLTKGA